MAQIGRIYYVVQNDSGTAQVSVNVEVRKQGAKISGGGSGDTGSGEVTITVNNPGGIIVGDSVVQKSGATIGTTSYGVSTVTATTIGINTGGAITWSDNDSLIPTTNLPTIYNEPTVGADVAANPIVTGSDGVAAAWAQGGFYCLYLSGGTTPITPMVVEDIYIPAESSKSNVFTQATAVGYVFDTVRDLTTAGAKILSIRRAGTEKQYIDKDGHLGATTFDGAVTVSTGGLAVTGNSTITGTLGGLTGLTVASGGASITGGLTVPTGGVTVSAGGLTVSAGAVSLPAGSIQTAALPSNLVVTAPATTLGAITDTALTNGAAETDRITTAAYTFTAANVGALIIVNVPYRIVCGSSEEGTVKVRLYMETAAGAGTYVVKAWGIFNNRSQTHSSHSISFSWFEAVVPTGAIRWKITDAATAVAGSPVCSYMGTLTNDGGTARAYIQIVEFKK
jgi:hypothetical protein